MIDRPMIAILTGALISFGPIIIAIGLANLIILSVRGLGWVLEKVA